jgi:protein-S-isoprenylcysteine O-methyltransferase Ste14
MQKDRGHKVITNRPYKIIRNPWYLAGILYILSITLMIGSVIAFIPVGIYILLISIHTMLEDKALK